jgi:hypothetical protein
MVWVYVGLGLVVVIAVAVIVRFLARPADSTCYFHVTWDGRILVVRGTGREYWIEQAGLDNELLRLRQQPNPVIFCTRERPTEQPPSNVVRAFEQIAATQIPIKILKKPHRSALCPPGRGGGKPTADVAREWCDAPGYVNCLLVALADGSASSIELADDRPLPDLLDLAHDNEHLKAWLGAQYIQDQLPAPSSVFRILKRMADLRRGRTEGTLLAVHVQNDDSMIQREYLVRSERDESRERLRITLLRR